MNRKKKMIIIWIAAMIVAVAAFAAIWHFLFGTPNPSLPAGRVNIAPASTSAAEASSSFSSSMPSAEQLRIESATWNIELATTTVAQARGLSYRASLGADDGMLFVFGRPGVQRFWMIGMNFPLDMIWIGDDGAGGSKVLGFAENAPAPASGTQAWSLPIYSSPDGVDKVLEVNAGSVAKYHIKVGDKVTIAPGA
ncbi:MAG: DUF192 domain-containing protein [Candidatus Pacebacteria bacterium]|nr:DUF192 domain-containing protein [Candidatus Paceibacterota bacterium]